MMGVFYDVDRIYRLIKIVMKIGVLFYLVGM